MASYRNDPYWTTARWDGIDANGRGYLKGERIFLFPKGQRGNVVFSGDNAERESRAFESAKFDESQMTGNW